MEESPDEVLVGRARAGDARAFEALVERHRDRLLAAARRNLPASIRARVSSSDVVQECLVAARARLPDFEDKGPGSFGRWLSGILRHKVRDQVRDHWKRDRRSAAREARPPSRTDGPSWADKAPSPGTVLQGREQVNRVLEAIASLPEDQRTILRLVHEGGMSAAQAGAEMGRSAEAARKLYARGVAALAKAVTTKRRPS
jgi:RNA polymerase sigma-70 factor (subfamily 1)